MRILARCIEAVNNPLGEAIGGDVANVIAQAPGRPAIGVVDPFAGSCNGLYAMLRHLPAAKGIGFEIQQAVFDLTTRNIVQLNAPIDLVLGSYKDHMLNAVESVFDFTDLRAYNFNVPGFQPGILLGTLRWSPQVGP